MGQQRSVVTTDLALRFAAVAPGPRSALAAIAAVEKMDPSMVSSYLGTVHPRARLDDEQTIGLWASRRGNYGHSVCAVLLCANHETASSIGASDDRKHVREALDNRNAALARAATVGIPESYPAWVLALVRSEGFTERLALDMVGVDRALDACLTRDLDLREYPALTVALIDETVCPKDNGRVRMFAGRPDFAELAQRYDFVAPCLLSQHRAATGHLLAAVPSLPEHVYEELACPQPDSTNTHRERSALGGNPSVPRHIVGAFPARLDTLSVVANELLEAVGDSSVATRVLLQLLAASSEYSVAEVVAAATAVASDPDQVNA